MRLALELLFDIRGGRPMLLLAVISWLSDRKFSERKNIYITFLSALTQTPAKKYKLDWQLLTWKLFHKKQIV